MTNAELLQRRDAALERSRHTGKQIDALTAQGVKLTDPRIAALMTTRDAALTETERYQREYLANPRDGTVPNAIPNGGRAERSDEEEAFDRYCRTGDGGGLEKTEGYFVIPRSMVERRVRERHTLTVSGDVAGAVPADLSEQVNLDLQFQGALRAAGAAERETFSDLYVEIVLKGDQVAMAPEVPATTASDDPDITTVSFPIKKGRGINLYSEARRDDARYNIGAVVAADMVDQMLRLEDSQLVSGSGVGLNHTGMLNSGDLPATTDISGTTADQVTNTLADQGSVPKLLTLQGTLPARFQSGAVWMGAAATFSKIRALVTATGEPAFPELRAGKVLLGQPVIYNDAIPVGGVDGNKVLIYGNFSRFRIVRKPEGIAIRLLNERYADQDCVAVRGIYRFGGGMLLADAFRVGVV